MPGEDAQAGLQRVHSEDRAIARVLPPGVFRACAGPHAVRSEDSGPASFDGGHPTSPTKVSGRRARTIDVILAPVPPAPALENTLFCQSQYLLSPRHPGVRRACVEKPRAGVSKAVAVHRFRSL